MMLKTSSRKINPFFGMLSFTVRKNFGITVILCIISLLYCPGNLLIELAEVNYDFSFFNMDYIEHFAFVVSAFAGAAVVIFNILNFSFLYKKSSCDVFHSLPLTRSELLLSRSLAGIISTLIPVILCYVSYGILCTIYPPLGELGQLAYYLLHTVLIILVSSSFSLIFIVSAGSIFDLVVSLVGVNVALLLIVEIFTYILSETLIGYSNNYSLDIMYNLSPVYMCASSVNSAADVMNYGVSSNSIEFFIRSAIYIAVFTLAVLLLYNYRKSEKCGQGYAYKFMFIICSLLAGICGGFVIGMMFANYGFDKIIFWVYTLVGAVLISVIYGVVSNRGFKKVTNSIITGVGAFAIIGLVALIGVTGCFGYSRRVPEVDAVELAYIDFDGDYIRFENPEKVIALHNDIVAKEAFDNYDMRIEFEYELKNGKDMSRLFYVNSSELSESLIEIYKSDERIQKMFDYIDNDISAITVECYDDYGLHSVNITKNQAYEFFQEYKKDLKNCDVSIINQDPQIWYDFTVITKDEDYYHFCVDIFKDFTNSEQYIADNFVFETVNPY